MKNYKKFLRRLILNRFLTKTLRVSKITTKSFLKISRSEATLNYTSCHSCIKLTHTTVGEARWSQCWLKGCNEQLHIPANLDYFMQIRWLQLFPKAFCALITKFKFILPQYWFRHFEFFKSFSSKFD